MQARTCGTGNIPIPAIDKLEKLMGGGCQKAGSCGIPGKKCFIAGTPVWTPQGSQAIETIKVGDIVLSRDVKTRQTVFRRVKQTFIRTAPGVLHLTLVKGGVTEKIGTTPEHPFYVAGIGFVDAGNLKPGMVIEQVSSDIAHPQLMAQSRYNDATGSMLSRWLAQVGDWITQDWMGFKATEAIALTKPAKLVVKSLRYSSNPRKVYNFEVEDTHTYVVGKSKALVHNATRYHNLDGPHGNQRVGNKEYDVYKQDGKDILVPKGQKFDEITHGYKLGKDGKLTRLTTSVVTEARRKKFMGPNPVRTTTNGDLHPDFKDWARKNHTTRGSGNDIEVEYDGKWYPIKKMDQAHKEGKDAVIWWNNTGRKLKGHVDGKVHPKVREWMRNRDNYTLQPKNLNRSDGARLGENYQDI